jgi:hypothetical protein
LTVAERAGFEVFLTTESDSGRSVAVVPTTVHRNGFRGNNPAPELIFKSPGLSSDFAPQVHCQADFRRAHIPDTDSVICDDDDALENQ